MALRSGVSAATVLPAGTALATIARRPALLTSPGEPFVPFRRPGGRSGFSPAYEITPDSLEYRRREQLEQLEPPWEP